MDKTVLVVVGWKRQRALYIWCKKKCTKESIGDSAKSTITWRDGPEEVDKAVLVVVA